MARYKRKPKNQYDFNIVLIDQINDLKLQNKRLREKMRTLENRVIDLEISTKMGRI